MPSTDNTPAGGLRALSLRRLAQEAGSLAGGEMATLALLLVQGVMVARTLGSDLLGVWAYMQAMVGLPRALLGFRTAEALGRFLVAGDAEADVRRALVMASARWIELAVSAMTFLIAFAAAPFVASRMAHHPEFTPLFRLYTLTALVTWVPQLWEGTLRHRRSFGRLAELPVRMHLAHVTILAGCFAAGRLDFGVVVGTSLAHVVLLAGLQWRDVRRAGISEAPWRACWHQRRAITGFWKYMLTGYLENTLRSVMGQGDVFILGWWNGTAAVGNYRLAKTVAAALAGLGRSMAMVCFQDFSEQLAGGQARRLRPYLRRVNRLWLPLVLLAVVALGTASPWLIRTLYGPAFDLAPALLQIGLVGSMAGIGLFWGRPLLMAQLELRTWVTLIYVTGPLITVLMVLASRYLGPVGFTAAFNLMPLVGSVAAAWLAWRALGRLETGAPPAA